MQTRRLGRTDLSIAPLVLGGNVFGWTADKKTSFAVLDRFAAAGLNAIDTADVYSTWVPGNQGGESETIIGEWMKARGNRGRIIVITKVGSPMGTGQEGLKARLYRGGGRGVAEAAARPTHRPLSLALAGHGDAVRGDARRLSAPDRAGKNPLVRRLQPRRDAARRRARGRQGQGAAALRGPAAGIQSLRPRGIRRRPCAISASREEIGVITYFSLAKGFLSGKYRSEADLARARAAAASRPISIRAASASSPRSTRSPRGTRPSRPKSRSPGSSRGPASPRRSPARPRSSRWTA